MKWMKNFSTEKTGLGFGLAISRIHRAGGSLALPRPLRTWSRRGRRGRVCPQQPHLLSRTAPPPFCQAALQHHEAPCWFLYLDTSKSYYSESLFVSFSLCIGTPSVGLSFHFKGSFLHLNSPFFLKGKLIHYVSRDSAQKYFRVCRISLFFSGYIIYHSV